MLKNTSKKQVKKKYILKGGQTNKNTQLTDILNNVTNISNEKYKEILTFLKNYVKDNNTKNNLVKSVTLDLMTVITESYGKMLNKVILSLLKKFIPSSLGSIIDDIKEINYIYILYDYIKTKNITNITLDNNIFIALVCICYFFINRKATCIR